MPSATAPLQFLQQFRCKLLGVFPRRADALFELVDALLLTLVPRSPVELSASPAFRRRFSMVSDALRKGDVDEDQARQLLAAVGESNPRRRSRLAGMRFTRVTAHPNLARMPRPWLTAESSIPPASTAPCQVTSTAGWGA